MGVVVASFLLGTGATKVVQARAQVSLHVVVLDVLLALARAALQVARRFRRTTPVHGKRFRIGVLSPTVTF